MFYVPSFTNFFGSAERKVKKKENTERNEKKQGKSECWVECWVAERMGGVCGVQCLDWCWGVLESMFSCLGSNNDENDTEE